MSSTRHHFSQINLQSAEIIFRRHKTAAKNLLEYEITRRNEQIFLAQQTTKNKEVIEEH